MVNFFKKQYVFQTFVLLSITILCGLYYYWVQDNFMPNAELLGNISNYYHVFNGLGKYRPYNFFFDAVSALSCFICGYTYEAVWLCNTLLHCIITFLTLNLVLKINGKFRYYLIPVFLFMWGIVSLGESQQYGLVSEVIYQYPFDNHTAPTIGALICCNIIAYLHNSYKKRTNIVLSILLLLNVIYFTLYSDALFILAFVCPFIVYLIIKYKKKILSNKFLALYICIALIGLIALKYLSMHIPMLNFLTAEKQSQYGGAVYGVSNFNNVYNIKQSIDNYIIGITGYFNCQIWNRSILNIDNFAFIIKILLLVATVVYTLLKIIRVKNYSLDSLFSISIIMMFIGYTASRDSSTTIINIRYLTPTVPFIMINLCSVIDKIFGYIYPLRNKIYLELSVITSLLCIFAIERVWEENMYDDMTYYESQLQEIADVIQNNNLGPGIAPGWAAPNISACTNGNVLVEAGQYDGEMFYVNYVINSYPVSKRDLNYVIFGKHENYTYGNNFSYSDLITLYGEADDVYTTEEFTLYYYKNGLVQENSILWSIDDRICFLGDYEKNGDSYIMYPESIQYGPYLNADVGTYEVIIRGEGLSDATVYVSTDIGTVVIEPEITYIDDVQIIYNFTLNCISRNVEFIVKNTTQHEIKIDTIYVTESSED